MARNKTSGRGGARIGTTSLILVFTVLCLVIFGTLSLSSALADSKLTKKNAEAIAAYYKADGIAVEMLKEINDAVLLAAETSDNQQEYQKALTERFSSAYNQEEGSITYQADMNEEQYILVRLLVAKLQDVEPNEENYVIETWKVLNLNEYEIDDTIKIWDGSF